MYWKHLTFKLITALALVLSVLAVIGISILLESKTMVYDSVTTTQNEEVTPFPVSVNSFTQVIEENTSIDSFFSDSLANAPSSKNNWWNQIASIFSSKAWYQNLASPVSRIIVIWPGERKEEVSKSIGDILRWNKADRDEFKNLIDTTEPIINEGKYFPGQYVAHRHATPLDIKQLIEDSFQNEVMKRYTPEVSARVPLEDALIIASLLEREASDFDNMREISGVIWNRLFIDMPLQLDATLQYAKGSRAYEPSWWPVVRPQDKYIDSPFNTYQNSGLPPAPIANPSAESILAALNPIQTECLFYFHTKNKQYHCSKTYEEHVSKLKSIYGRGS